MNTVKFNCVINSTDPTVPLGLEIWIDEIKLFDQEHLTQIQQIEHEMSDDDGEHELKFVLKNKLPDHTQVDAEGKIISDARVTVNNIEFDGIDCQYLTTTSARYQHNFNGTGESVSELFYGEMGCNGIVTLKFSTPIYLWLIEKM